MSGMINVEKGSQRYFGLTVLVLSLILVLSSLGRASYIQWLAVVFSMLLGIVLWSEGGVRSYLAKGGYKKVTANDLIVWLAFIFGAFLIINGLLLINTIKNIAPEWLISFISINGVIGGIIAGLLGIFLILTPRPKA